MRFEIRKIYDYIKCLGGIVMVSDEIQEEFKRILEYGIRLGNENESITVHELVDELTVKLRNLMNKTRELEEV